MKPGKVLRVQPQGGGKAERLIEPCLR